MVCAGQLLYQRLKVSHRRLWISWLNKNTVWYLSPGRTNTLTSRVFLRPKGTEPQHKAMKASAFFHRGEVQRWPLLRKIHGLEGWESSDASPSQRCPGGKVGISEFPSGRFRCAPFGWRHPRQKELAHVQSRRRFWRPGTSLPPRGHGDSTQAWQAWDPWPQLEQGHGSGLVPFRLHRTGSLRKPAFCYRKKRGEEQNARFKNKGSTLNSSSLRV